MAYEVVFVINDRRAKLENTFTDESNAQEAAAGIDQKGYPVEVVDLDESI